MPIYGHIKKHPHSHMTTTKIAKKAVNISQSNELTEAAYHLPLQAKRVLWLCLMQCYFNKEEPEDESAVFTITVADYQKFFKVNVDTASADVKKGVSVLADSNVTFYPKDGEFEEVKRPWLAEAGLKRGRGKWQIEFNYKVMPYLMGLTSQFTTYSLYDCGKLKSVKVIRLYESLCQFRHSGIWITTSDWLSERFMLPPSQRSNMAEMKRTFLNPALKNINESTPLKASMKQDEDGRLIFTILDKTA
ncbi:initiator RepB protein [Escherichia coli TA249]|nr:initiator RepB protein [Escherichia coli TA249]